MIVLDKTNIWYWRIKSLVPQDRLLLLRYLKFKYKYKHRGNISRVELYSYYLHSFKKKTDHTLYINRESTSSTDCTTSTFTNHWPVKKTLMVKKLNQRSKSQNNWKGHNLNGGFLQGGPYTFCFTCLKDVILVFLKFLLIN